MANLVSCQPSHTARQGTGPVAVPPSAPAAPVGLLVDGVSSPLAIERGTARFSWGAADAERGERQTAYQILVSSAPQGLAGETGEAWDSGKVD